MKSETRQTLPKNYRAGVPSLQDCRLVYWPHPVGADSFTQPKTLLSFLYVTCIPSSKTVSINTQDMIISFCDENLLQMSRAVDDTDAGSLLWTGLSSDTEQVLLLFLFNVYTSFMWILRWQCDLDPPWLQVRSMSSINHETYTKSRIYLCIYKQEKK